jgi:ABC-type multidrug transport system fused ATPase/permease subunit
LATAFPLHFTAARPLDVTSLIAASCFSGIAEAAVLAMLAQVGVALAGGRDTAELPYTGSSVDVTAMIYSAIGIGVVRLVAQLFVAHQNGKLAAEARDHLRRRIFGSFSAARWPEKSQLRESDLQEMLTTNVEQVGSATYVSASALVAATNFLVMLGAAFALSPLVASAISGCGLVIAIALRPISAISRGKARDYSAAHAEYAATVNESSRLGLEFTVGGVAEAAAHSHDSMSRHLRRAYYPVVFLSGLLPAAYQGMALIAAIASLGVVNLTSSLSIATLGGVVLLILRSLAYSQQLQSAHQALSHLEPYAESLVRLEQRLSSGSLSGDTPLEAITHLEMDGVTFEYRRGSPALSDLSFSIAAGETIGIVGPSGAGKSTLIQLLLRLREPTTGIYLVNGRDAAQFCSSDWWSRVALVPQEPRLLTGTVMENIAFLRPHVTAEQATAAAKRAHIHSEIVALPAGYDSIISERVNAVSGGQRQRLCIARALAGSPELLVLDEPTSGLDAHSEAAVQTSLAGLRGTVTMIIVAHRLSTLALCDRIGVVQGGRLESLDNAEQLERSSRYFREATRIARVGLDGVLPS